MVLQRSEIIVKIPRKQSLQVVGVVQKQKNSGWCIPYRILITVVDGGHVTLNTNETEEDVTHLLN
jgi:hypothetical protein